MVYDPENCTNAGGGGVASEFEPFVGNFLITSYTKKELLLSEETFSAFEKGLFSSFLY